jgi:hypothetical protein
LEEKMLWMVMDIINEKMSKPEVIFENPEVDHNEEKAS